MRDQIEQREADNQEDDEPLDPRHLGLVILPVFFADYSNALPYVQDGHLNTVLSTRCISRL